MSEVKGPPHSNESEEEASEIIIQSKEEILNLEVGAEFRIPEGVQLEAYRTTQYDAAESQHHYPFRVDEREVETVYPGKCRVMYRGKGQAFVVTDEFDARGYRKSIVSEKDVIVFEGEAHGYRGKFGYVLPETTE